MGMAQKQVDEAELMNRAILMYRECYAILSKARRALMNGEYAKAIQILKRLKEVVEDWT